jgi:hypothetical protein
MLESLLAFLSKLGSSLSGRLIDWAIERFKRPRIQLKRAPENLFHHLAPGTSLARVREVLGTAQRVEGEWHSFAFSDAHVQIGSRDGQSVESIAVVLPEPAARAQFPLVILPIVLGKSTLGDVLALIPEAEIEIKKDSSTKHWCFWTECYFGFSGLYRHYLFGVIEAPSVLSPEFEWDHANNRLASDPKTVRLNWMAVSSSQGAAESFNFWAFV